MRYVSKAEKERQLWMTLVEAIKYTTSKERCDQREAVDNLFRAIADNNVRVLLGNWSSDPDSLDGFNVVSRHEFQGEIKVCLDAPGNVMLDSRATKTKYPIGHISSYAKVEIVDGPVVDIFDQDGPVPDVNTSDYWPLLVSRDDIQKWPFAPEKEPPASEALITNKRTLRHRRNATKEAIMAIWGPKGLPAGLMDPRRDKAINDWLNKKGLQPVGARTIRRAFAELTVAAIDRV